MSDDLAGFLLTRIAEDEADAFGAIGRHWDAREYRRIRTSSKDEPRSTTVVSSGGVDAHWEPPRPSDPGTTFKHIARHDPARVLAECEAKRRIVERLMSHDDAGICQGTAVALLRTVAQPYAGHPDFREEWRP